MCTSVPSLDAEFPKGFLGIYSGFLCILYILRLGHSKVLISLFVSWDENNNCYLLELEGKNNVHNIHVDDDNYKKGDYYYRSLLSKCQAVF